MIQSCTLDFYVIWVVLVRVQLRGWFSQPSAGSALDHLVLKFSHAE